MGMWGSYFLVEKGVAKSFLEFKLKVTGPNRYVDRNLVRDIYPLSVRLTDPDPVFLGSHHD